MKSNSTEMQGLSSLLSPSQLSSLQDLKNGHHQQHQIPNSQFHHTQIQSYEQSSNRDEFLDQMMSPLPSYSWTPNSNWEDLNPPPIKERESPPQFQQFDESTLLAAKLRQHQIGGGTPSSTAASKSALAMMLQHQQQMMMSRGVAVGNGMRRSPSSSPGSGDGDSGFFPLPLSLNGGDLGDQSQNEVGDVSALGLMNDFTGSLHGSGQTPNHNQQFNHPQGQKFVASTAVTNGAPPNGSSGGSGAPAQTRQRVRARRGQATDPHSIAERLRRERIAERMKALQELVPNANKTDKASMLDEIIEYVKFLQLQVKVLSMSRLGGAGGPAPVAADMSSEANRKSNGTQTASTNSSMTVTENHVAKLMKEDMGSAMQYLQRKGLCLMPISLATAISTSTGHTRSHLTSNAAANNPLNGSNGGEGPTSPSVSALSVQSATIANNGPGKDADSV